MADERGWTRDDATGQYVHEFTIWINVPVEQVFTHWARFEEFPRLMRHITRVEKTGSDVWHWEARIDGQHVAWDAVMPDFRQNEVISWRSVGGVTNAGSIHFLPEGVGTRMQIRLTYDPPYGIVGDLVAQAKTNADLHEDVEEDLQSFKQKLETGMTGQERAA